MSASNVIPVARVSPRIANGCICWYEGDTFSLRLRLELEDQDGLSPCVYKMSYRYSPRGNFALTSSVKSSVTVFPTMPENTNCCT